MSTQQPDSPSNERTVVQVFVKTLFTHTFAIINYGSFSSLLPIPTKHNIQFFRVVIFGFIPTLIVTQVLFDLVRTIIRLLRDPDEFGWRSLPFYLHGIIGIRAARESYDESSGSPEQVRLLDIPDVESTRRTATPWSWRRFGQIAIALLALAQAIGTMVLFVRRCQHNATTGWDYKSFLMAIGSTVASILTMCLLFFGHRWTFSAETELPISRTTEIKRLVVETIASGLLLEWIRALIPNYTNWPGEIPRYLSSMWKVLWPRSAEQFLLCFAVLALVLFRHDIAKRLNIKLYPIAVALLVVGFVWMMVDTIAVVVQDTAQFINPWASDWTQYDKLRWADPLENLIPVI